MKATPRRKLAVRARSPWSRVTPNAQIVERDYEGIGPHTGRSYQFRLVKALPTQIIAVHVTPGYVQARQIFSRLWQVEQWIESLVARIDPQPQLPLE